jgi:prevent-host-death family protein
MKQITATEANRMFSKLLNEVSKGEEFVVTSHGKPVARVTPVGREEAERARWRAKLIARLRSQKPRKSPVKWTRDELYERDD